MFSTSTIFLKHNQKLLFKKDFSESAEKEIYKPSLAQRLRRSNEREHLCLDVIKVELVENDDNIERHKRDAPSGDY